MIKLINALLVMSNAPKSVIDLYKEEQTLKNLNDFWNISPFVISFKTSKVPW